MLLWGSVFLVCSPYIFFSACDVNVLNNIDLHCCVTIPKVDGIPRRYPLIPICFLVSLFFCIFFNSFAQVGD